MPNTFSKQRYKAILLSSTSTIVAKFIGSAIGIFSVPLLVNYMGKEKYGLWIVVGSIVAWLQLSDFGVANGLVNILSEYKGKNNKEAANSAISTALFFLIIISILLMALIVPFYKYIPINSILKLHNPEMSDLSKQAFLIIMIFFIINIPLGIINNIFKAYQKLYVTSWYQIFSSIISIFLIFIGVKCQFTFVFLLIFLSIPSLISVIFMWIHLKFSIPEIKISFSAINVSSLNRIFKTCVPLFLFQIGSLLVNQITNVLLANKASLVMVSDYNIIMKLYLLVFFIGASISTPFYAPIREALEKNEISWVRKAIFRAVIIRTSIVLFMSIPLIFLGSPLISLWVKQPITSTFGHNGWLLVMTLAIVSSISSTLSEVLTVLDDIWFQIVLVFVSGAIVLSGMFFLIEKVGLYGVFIPPILSTLSPILFCYQRVNTIVNRNKNMKIVCE